LLSLVIRDYPDDRKKFIDLTDEWLTEEQADELYWFLWGWFNEPISGSTQQATSALPIENAETSQSLLQITEVKDVLQ